MAIEHHNNHVHKLHSGCFALAAALTVSIAYTICALLLHYLPEHFIKFKSTELFLKNTDLLTNNLEITLNGFLQGLGYVFVSTFVFAWLFGKIYNLFEHYCSRAK